MYRMKTFLMIFFVSVLTSCSHYEKSEPNQRTVASEEIVNETDHSVKSPISLYQHAYYDNKLGDVAIDYYTLTTSRAKYQYMGNDRSYIMGKIYVDKDHDNKVVVDLVSGIGEASKNNLGSAAICDGEEKDSHSAYNMFLEKAGKEKLSFSEIKNLINEELISSCKNAGGIIIPDKKNNIIKEIN
ncbi:MAG: hypothetical protein Q7U04_13190, partial [Bacteriovorax sp.]|nr:hypothetical protein [Bacteriovorax sp.]